MTWFTAQQVSVNNGQTIVSVVNATSDDIAIAQEAGGLVIGNQPPVEIKRTFLDGSNNKKIELRLPWPYANQTNQPAVAFPTDADLAEATRILREVASDFDMQPTASSVAVRTVDGRLKATNAVESNDVVVLGQIATQAEAQAGVVSNKVMSPLRTKEAIDAQRAYATQSEVNAGSVNNKVVAPNTLQILSRDRFRQSVESASGGKNTVVYDAQGNPNIMVVVPRFNYEDLNLPALELGTGTPTAFQTNGAPRGEILIAKYLASTPSGTTGCSVIGGAQPRVSVNFDAAKNLCVNKGNGWHLMSQHEWAAIALWCLANGAVPRGNTFYGRSHERPWETARRADNGMPGDTAGTPRTDTGKGPRTWTHDHTDFGIHDLVGNCWEWVDQFKLVDGQIITTPDNNPALAEAEWTATGAFYDAISASGGAPRLANSVSIYQGTPGDSQNAGNSNSIDFSALTKDPGYTPQLLLRRLLAETASNTTVGGRLYTRNFGERLPLRGGSWTNGAYAGLGALLLNYSRLYSSSSFGFRPAFFV